MIRPLTLLCFCAFAGAGAWLYQVKHAVALKDRQLLEIRRETEQARQRIDILRAEWALLNEPERLRQTASRILTLEPMQPQHFARVTEFERRLPTAVAFAGPPALLAPEPAQAAPAVAVAAAPATPAARPAPPSAPAVAEARGVEAPAPRALVAVVAAQRAEQAARPAPQPVRAATANPMPPAPVAVAAAAPPAPRPARQVAPAPHPAAQPVLAVTRVTQTTVTPTAIASALGSASSLGRPLLAPPVPIGSAAAATLHGTAARLPVPTR